MGRPVKITTASLGDYQIDWLRDLAAAEPGGAELARVCDVARGRGSVSHREVLAARRTVVDEINRRSGYAALAAAGRPAASRGAGRILREVADYLREDGPPLAEAAPRAAPTREPVLELPAHEILRRQPDPPHVARLVVERAWPNEHGTYILYSVRQGRRGRDWWISASLDGIRMSNTIHTSVADRGRAWVRAVSEGRVRVAR